MDRGLSLFLEGVSLYFILEAFVLSFFGKVRLSATSLF